MHARIVQTGQGLPLLVRPLRNGDTDTVRSVFERLGPESRRARFNGPKPFLTTAELRQLARVDATRHALVGLQNLTKRGDHRHTQTRTTTQKPA